MKKTLVLILFRDVFLKHIGIRGHDEVFEGFVENILSRPLAAR